MVCKQIICMQCSGPMVNQIEHDCTSSGSRANGQVQCPGGLMTVLRGVGPGRRKCESCREDTKRRRRVLRAFDTSKKGKVKRRCTPRQKPARFKGSGCRVFQFDATSGLSELLEAPRPVNISSMSRPASSHIKSSKEIVTPSTSDLPPALSERATPPVYDYANTSSDTQNSGYENNFLFPAFMPNCRSAPIDCMIYEEAFAPAYSTPDHRQSLTDVQLDTLYWLSPSSNEAGEYLAANDPNLLTSTSSIAAAGVDEEPSAQGWNFGPPTSTGIASAISGNDNGGCMISNCEYLNSVEANYVAEQFNGAWDPLTAIVDEATYPGCFAYGAQPGFFEEGMIQGNDEERNKYGYCHQTWNEYFEELGWGPGILPWPT